MSKAEQYGREQGEQRRPQGRDVEIIVRAPGQHRHQFRVGLFFHRADGFRYLFPLMFFQYCHYQLPEAPPPPKLPPPPEKLLLLPE